MATAQQARPATHGSRTQTIASTPTNESGNEAGPSQPVILPTGVLKLRGGPSRKAKVEWGEDVVDNEGMGRKKSKICCIYTKPRAFDESSSESGSGSEDDRDHAAGPCGKAGADKGKGKALRREVGGTSGNVEETSEPESESDGGGVDGRARPARKPVRRQRKHHHGHNHEHSADGCGGHAVKPNKYDAQPRAASKAVLVT